MQKCLSFSLSVLMIVIMLLPGCARKSAVVLESSVETIPAVIPETTEQVTETEPYEPSVPETTVPETIIDDAELEAFLAQVGAAYGVVGIQVAIVNGGIIAGSYAYGWATQDEDLMTADHKVRIASISKVFVGIAAMLLQDRGIINLDDDIGMYWDISARNPSYPDIPITIRYLLSHTSSIICYDDSVSVDYSSVRSRLKDGYADLIPGDISSRYYNNYAFRVLGMTLELAAGQRLDDILQDCLFTTMDIDASFASGDIRATDQLVTLYDTSGSVTRSTQTQQSLHLTETAGENGIFFAGGMTISASDLAKILALLVNDGVYEETRLLTAESVAALEEYYAEPLSDGTFQALPMRYITDLYGQTGIYMQAGSAYGTYHLFSYNPYTSDGVIVLTTGANASEDQYGSYSICNEICSYIYNMIA